jgi:hypothetical protein
MKGIRSNVRSIAWKESKNLADGMGLRMVERFLDREDGPEGPLIVLMDGNLPAI